LEQRSERSIAFRLNGAKVQQNAVIADAADDRRIQMPKDLKKSMGLKHAVPKDYGRACQTCIRCSAATYKAVRGNHIRNKANAVHLPGNPLASSADFSRRSSEHSDDRDSLCPVS
jgi:hypothetical protein